MSELDDRIRQALQDEDAELLAEFGKEPSIFEMLMETVRGRHRWLTVFGVCWGIIFTVLAMVSAVAFFRAEATREMLMWAAACVICVSALSMVKVWYWMELNKNAVTREIKRLELQIARLAARIED
jgi:hypothetical protein